MPENGDFPVGSTIWPLIQNVGGDAAEDLKREIRDAVTQLAQYVADALGAYGIPRFAFPLFRPFNAILAETKDSVLCVGSPLSGGLAMLRFFDWRNSPRLGLDQVVNDVKAQLGWIDTFSFEIPISMIRDQEMARERSLRTLADDFAQRIRVKLEKAQRRVFLQPIFQAGLEDLELDNSLCFVLMPFGPPSDRIYAQVVTPAVVEVGLRPLRADQIFSPTPIVEDIWVHIATSRLIIADVTGKNPNVFYELGLAHAVGKPVIVITQSKDDVPFDIGYIRYFHYTDNQSGWARLSVNLRNACRAVLGSSNGP